jgi:very-short-patch-repair endonuclease
MAIRGRYRPYRRKLVRNARLLRRDLTPAERRLWFEFLRDYPQKFTRQKPLGAYVADFYCASARLVVEVDGDSHYAGGAMEQDAARTKALARLSLRVVRFTNDDVLRNFESVCMAILSALQDWKKT